MTADTLTARASAAGERTGLPRGVIITALAFGAYMAALDNSIVNAVLPVVADSFGTDLASIEWVVTSYLLVQSALLLTFGRLGDLWGHKRVYLAGLAVFVASSALCGLAPSTPYMVAWRSIQAIGASMIVANLAALLTSVFPPEQRGRAVGIQATIVYVGLATGAPLGGWLTGALGWRSIFYVNVPLGLLALLLGSRVNVPIRASGRREPFDLVGAGIYVVGLMLLLLGLNQGHVWGWTSAPVVGCLLIGAAFLAAWVIVELRSPSPMLDLRLFTQRTFSAPVMSALFSYGASISTSFLLPFALILGRGLSPAQAGLILTSQPIVMAITASISGSLSDRIGTRIPATIGMVFQAIGLFLLSRVTVDTPLVLIVGMLLLTGLGIGLFTSPNNSAVLGAVPSQRRGVANGILGTARTLGMLLGIALAGAVYATTLGHVDAESASAVLQAAGTGFLVASAIAIVGAVTSATRPVVAKPDAPAH
jgi:EmrB/QacA subfamily drug resistance transporter